MHHDRKWKKCTPTARPIQSSSSVQSWGCWWHMAYATIIAVPYLVFDINTKRLFFLSTQTSPFILSFNSFIMILMTAVELAEKFVMQLKCMSMYCIYVRSGHSCRLWKHKKIITRESKKENYKSTLVSFHAVAAVSRPSYFHSFVHLLDCAFSCEILFNITNE